MSLDGVQDLRVHIRWMIRRDMPEILDIENQSFEFSWSEEDFIRCLRQRNSSVAPTRPPTCTRCMNEGTQDPGRTAQTTWGPSKYISKKDDPVALRPIHS